MADRVTVAIGNGGELCFVHSDAAVALLGAAGDIHMRRASHVEPWPALSREAQLGFLRQHAAHYLKPELGMSMTSSNLVGDYNTSELLTKWFADLSPVGGHVAGPFATKGEALTFEVDWINRNALTCDVPTCEHGRTDRQTA